MRVDVVLVTAKAVFSIVLVIVSAVDVDSSTA
jgi:hypothetical protein